MKLTKADLERINTIPSLAKLCKAVLDVVDYGTNQRYCFDVMESLIPVFKNHCKVFKLYTPPTQTAQKEGEFTK